MSKLTLGFIPEVLVVALDNLLPSRKTPAGLITSRKYRQIVASIAEIGLIEPLWLLLQAPEPGNIYCLMAIFA